MKKYRLNSKGKAIFYIVMTALVVVLVYVNIILWGGILR